MKQLLTVLVISLIGAFAYPGTRGKILSLVGSNMPDLEVLDAIPIPFKNGADSENPSLNLADLHEKPRSWTLADGSKLDAVVLAADSKHAQIRVLKTQGVAQVKLSVFAEEDRGIIDSWIQSSGDKGIAGHPIRLKTHNWPRHWKQAKAFSLRPITGTNRWRSDHFEIVNLAGINRESLEAIVRICESVDGALRSLPLPLPVNWGRPTDEVRKIIIENENTSQAPVTTAGYWDSRTGNVHIFSNFLIEPDHQLVVFEFDKPEKVQKYDVLVHEVTHQSTAALIFMDVPAWLPEGLAEYMAATQYAPAAYQFTNTHVSLKHHINKGVLGDRIVKERRMNIVHLENFMGRHILEWNHFLESGDMEGGLQYNQALLVLDYFIHHDHPEGRHFRRYLECILSGVPEEEARELHLLRGRSYQDLEYELTKLWKPLGFALEFRNRAELREGDVVIDWAAEDLKRTIAAERAARN